MSSKLREFVDKIGKRRLIIVSAALVLGYIGMYFLAFPAAHALEISDTFGSVRWIPLFGVIFCLPVYVWAWVKYADNTKYATIAVAVGFLLCLAFNYNKMGYVFQGQSEYATSTENDIIPNEGIVYDKWGVERPYSLVEAWTVTRDFSNVNKYNISRSVMMCVNNGGKYDIFDTRGNTKLTCDHSPAYVVIDDNGQPNFLDTQKEFSDMIGVYNKDLIVVKDVEKSTDESQSGSDETSKP